MRISKIEKGKQKIKIAMKELHIVDTVNSGRTAKEISEQSGFSVSKTRRLLNEMGPEGVVDYIREYNYWIFQRDKETITLNPLELKVFNAVKTMKKARGVDIGGTSSTSRILAYLYKAGLLNKERKGVSVWYSVNKSPGINKKVKKL